MKNKVAIVGFDKDFIDDASDVLSIYGYFSLSDKCNQYDYLGNHHKIKNLPEDVSIIVVFDDISLRKKLFIEYKDKLVGYISPSASVSKHAKIGIGSVVMANSYISSDVVIGNLSKISVGVQIHHDVTIDDYNIVAPRATLLGKVSIGSGNYIGAGALIRNSITIGESNIIGMGANVIASAKNKVKLLGNPARSFDISN
jgi:sugar O-acyltransferase (sialic acid O-acetyltransferase NeuD family)